MGSDDEWLCLAWLDFVEAGGSVCRGHCEVGSALVMLITLPLLPDRSRHMVVEAIDVASALGNTPSNSTVEIFRRFLATLRRTGSGPLFGAIRAVSAGRRCGVVLDNLKSHSFRSVWL